MILDKELVMSDAQAFTAQGAHASTNVIDLVKAGDLDNMYLVVQVAETCQSGGGATVTIDVQTDDNADFSSPTSLIKANAVPVASLVQGFQVMKTRLPLSKEGKSLEQYLRVLYTVGTADLTAGAFDAFLVLDVPVS